MSKESFDKEGPSSGAAEERFAPDETVSIEAIRRYIAAHHKKLRAIVAGKVPESRVDDVTNDVVVEMLASRNLPATEAAVPSWAETLARNVIADGGRKRKRRARFQAPGVEVDEVAVEVALADDPWMIKPWLARLVAKDPAEQKVFDMICEKARTGHTYAEIAELHGISLTALSNQIFRLKQKYLPLRRKYRKNLAAVILLLAAALLAILFYLFGGKARPERAPLLPGAQPLHAENGEPLVAHPPPSASASAPMDGGQQAAPR